MRFPSGDHTGVANRSLGEPETSFRRSAPLALISHSSLPAPNGPSPLTKAMRVPSGETEPTFPWSLIWLAPPSSETTHKPELTPFDVVHEVSTLVLSGNHARNITSPLAGTDKG